MKFSTTLTYQYPTPYSSFPPEEFARGLQWAKDSGLDAAEVCICSYDGIDVPALRAQLDALELGCSTISTGQAFGREHISLLSADAQSVRGAQERLKQHIDAAKILGSKVTLGLLRGIGDRTDPAAERRALAERLQPVLEYADKQGVMLLIEAINRFECSILFSAEDTLAFVKDELGDPACVGILWDVFHANIEDPDFAPAIDLLGRHLQHVHLADSNRMFPGYGHLDFDGIIKKIKGSGFDQYYSFECFNQPSRDTVLQETAGFVARMRAL